MVRGRNTKGMVGLTLLFLPAIVQCAPTLSDHGRGAADGGRRWSSPEEMKHLRVTADVIGLAHSQVPALSAEFHKHPVMSADASPSASGIKSFPPPPSPLLMVLTGFVCISLVRDRRVWLTALTCLPWAGQAGLSLLPRLALCVAGEGCTRQRSPDHAAAPRRSMYTTGHPGEIERAYYTGLPGWLDGIPDRDLPASLQLSVRHPKMQSSCSPSVRCRRGPCGEGLSVSVGRLSRVRVDRRFGPLQPIIGSPGLFEVSAVNRLSLASGPVARVVTGLIRTNLARGPPTLRRIAHLLRAEGYRAKPPNCRVAECCSVVCEKAKGNPGSTDPEHVLAGRTRIVVLLARLQQSSWGMFAD